MSAASELHQRLSEAQAEVDRRKDELMNDVAHAASALYDLGSIKNDGVPLVAGFIEFGGSFGGEDGTVEVLLALRPKL